MTKQQEREQQSMGFWGASGWYKEPENTLEAFELYRQAQTGIKMDTASTDNELRSLCTQAKAIDKRVWDSEPVDQMSGHYGSVKN